DEVHAAGSSAAQEAEAVEVDETVAFDADEGDVLEAAQVAEDESSLIDLGKQRGAPKDGLSSGSGIDPVAEARESGVLEESSGSLNPDASVEFDELLTDDSLPSSASGKKARARKEDKEEVFATTDGTDEEDIFSDMGSEAEAVSGAEVIEAEEAISGVVAEE